MTDSATRPRELAQGIEPSAPSWVRDAVFYQIFPDRFANGDHSLDPEGVDGWEALPTRANFLGGDFAGMESRLDHVVDVGANAIYLTPVFAADRNHRYDTIDYLRIDEKLGDITSFMNFIDAAHRRGIRVVLDAVFNHCGEGHWAFRHVLAHGQASPYADWFKVNGWPIAREPEATYETCMSCKYLPQLNHANPAVRDYLFDVTRYWSGLGIDGWRLDVPFLMPMDFWKEFRTIVKSIDSEMYIVAEIWETAEEWLQGDIADGTMNYPLRTAIIDFAGGAIDGSDLAASLANIDAATPSWARASMLNLLGSHDTERLGTLMRGDRDAVRLAVGLQLTSRGAPMIYYGDEIGMRGGNDPGCRAPMIWDQHRWDLDLMLWHQKLARLRSENPALRGDVDKVVLVGRDIIVKSRSDGEHTVFVAANRSSLPVEIDASVVNGFRLDLVGNARVHAGPGGATVIVPAHSLVVLAAAAAPARRP